MSQELIHEELSESIIGAAMTVLNVLKPGLDEKLYERALVIELRKRGIESTHNASSRCTTMANSLGLSSPT